MGVAYVDTFRRIVLQPDGVTLTADDIGDTLTITRGNGVAFNPVEGTDSFEIDVNYELYMPVGTTELRLNDVHSNYSSVTLTGGSNITVTRVSDTEVSLAATVGGASKSISGITLSNPIVIQTTSAHSFTEGRPVTIVDVVGTTQLNGNEYYMDILTSDTFALYTNDALTNPVDGTSGFSAYVSGGVATGEYFPRTQLSELSDVETAGVVTNDILAYDGTEFVPTSTFIGDVKGSVVGDDSTILVDGVNGRILAPVEKFSGYTASPLYDINENGGVNFIDANVLLGFVGGSAQTANAALKSQSLAVDWTPVVGSIYTNNKFQIRTIQGNATDVLRDSVGLAPEGWGDTAIIGNINDTGSSVEMVGGIGVSGSYTTIVGEQVQINTDGNYPLLLNCGVQLGLNSGITFEGPFSDANDTYLVADLQTASRTITLPDASGTVVLIDSGGKVVQPLVGDLTGSVFADDSSLMVDGVSGNLYSTDIYFTGTLYQNGIAFQSGATVSDKSDNVDYNILFTSDTSGTQTVAGIDNGSLIYNPSTGQVSAVDFNSTSDENLKKNVTTIDSALNKLLDLRGVNFNWIENGNYAMGVIAQEVEKVIPEVVSTSGDTKRVNYGAMIGLLIEAIKEQQILIQDLSSKMKEL